MNGLVNLNLGGIVKSLSDVVSQWIPSPEEKAKVEQQMTDIIAQQNLQQAKNVQTGLEKGGLLNDWPGAVGWVCAFALFWSYVLAPLLHWIFPNAPPPNIDTTDLIRLLYSMLGLGGLHYGHKIVGVIKNG